MINTTSAHLFADNSNYGFTLDGIGSNRTIKTPLVVHDFVFEQSGALKVVLQYDPQSAADQEKITVVATKYPEKITIQGDQIIINDTLPTVGLNAKNLRHDGVNYMIEGTFDKNDQPIQRAFGIGINRSNSSIPNDIIDRSDEL